MSSVQAKGQDERPQQWQGLMEQENYCRQVLPASPGKQLMSVHAPFLANLVL
jgi:hypothetical protein